MVRELKSRRSFGVVAIQPDGLATRPVGFYLFFGWGKRHKVSEAKKEIPTKTQDRTVPSAHWRLWPHTACCPTSYGPTMPCHMIPPQSSWSSGTATAIFGCRLRLGRNGKWWFVLNVSALQWNQKKIDATKHTDRANVRFDHCSPTFFSKRLYRLDRGVHTANSLDVQADNLFVFV